MGAALAAVDRETIRERALAAVRSAIVDGRLAPGERLVERELCEALDVSRGSLREALRSLESQGLVDIVPHRGPSVARISVAQAREIYSVREVLEGLAARSMAERPDPQALARMARALDGLRSVVPERGDPVVLASLKADFYRALFDGAGNATLAGIMDTLLARIALLRRTSFTRPGRLPESIAEIAEIVDAIRAADPPRAEHASRLHVRRARDAALPLLAEAALPQASRSTRRER